MSYRINGTEFIIQPTTGRWMERGMLDMSGDGHPIYGAVREFELRWNLISQDQVEQAQEWYERTISGTVSIDLPKFRGSTYEFQTYSGCSLYEPGRGVYFTEHTTEFILMVGNIRIL